MWFKAILLLAVVYTSASGANTLDVHCDSTIPEGCHVKEFLDIHEPTTLNFIDADKWNNVIFFTIPFENNVTVFPSGFFDRFPKLVQVRISTGVRSIQKSDFKSAGSLTMLELQGNKINVVSNGVFSEAPKLEEIDLSENRIATIEDFAFNGLTKLEFIYLHSNQLKTLKKDTFAGAPSLVGLNFENNQIEVIEDGAFNLPNLRSVFLSKNLIRSLSDNVFSGAPKLFALSIAANGLSHIGQSFYKSNRLNAVVLDTNRIEDIDLLSFAKLPALLQLSLKFSGFQFKESPLTTPFTNSTITYLDISKNDLKNADVLKRLERFGLVNLEELNLEENQLTDLEDISDIKQKFRNITRLGLSGNKLTCDWMREATATLISQKVTVTSVLDDNTQVKNFGGIACL